MAMRIIYLHQYFNTPDMAGGTRSYEMARRLVDAGHVVHVVTSHRDPNPPVPAGWFETEEAGIHVHWLVNRYDNKMSFRDRIRSFVRFALASARKAASLPSDLVFATSTPLTIALPALYAKWRRRIPMVFEVRDLWPTGPIAMSALRNPLAIAAARWLEKTAYRNSAQIVALSPGMKEGIVATGYPPERVHVIPNSSDMDLFRVSPEVGQAFTDQHPYLRGGPLVTYAGTMGIVNVVDYLVEIAAEVELIDPTVRFLIVGDGHQEPVVRRRAEELGVLGRNTWMLPPVPKRHMPAVLSATDVSVCILADKPHLQRNSANKVFDAFAAARPLMINFSGWIADLLEEHNAGLVVPPRDPPLAARLLHDFLTDQRRLGETCDAAARLADTMFSRDRLADDLRQVLELAAPESTRRHTS